MPSCLLRCIVHAIGTCHFGDRGAAGTGVQPESGVHTGAATGLTGDTESADVAITDDAAPLLVFSGNGGFAAGGGIGSEVGATTDVVDAHGWHSIGHVRQLVG